MPKKKRDRQLGEQQQWELPPGVKLQQTLLGHSGEIRRIAWSPDGTMLASPSSDRTIRVWDARTGEVVHVLKQHKGIVYCVAWSPDGKVIASGSGDKTIILWRVDTGDIVTVLTGHTGWVNALAWNPSSLLASGSEDTKVLIWDTVRGDLKDSFEGHRGGINALAWSPDGLTLASASGDRSIMLWDADAGSLSRVLGAHKDWVFSVAWSPDNTLVSASWDKTIRQWDATTGEQIHILEGHTTKINCVSLSFDGRLLATKSNDDIVRIWRCDTWEIVASINEPRSFRQSPSIAFHPKASRLATLGEQDTIIRIWELDPLALLSVAPSRNTVFHTTAKIVLVGDSGVGKTGLSWRLAYGEFRAHDSTHGQQFWVLNQLFTQRPDGTECEAILWDLAGQPDYRLIHALFLDDADLALILFDPTDGRDPLGGVEFWSKQLNVGQSSIHTTTPTKSGVSQSGCPAILVGARADRGDARLTEEELESYCRRWGIVGGHISTSAKEGYGVEELLRRMKDLIPWDQKTTTVTTVTFKRIKDYVLRLKENPELNQVIVRPRDLRGRLEKTDELWEFTEAEMMTAVGHLSNYGYVRVLRTSKSEELILLAPELLNNLAASFVLEARRNPKALGSLEEKRLLAGEYSFRELEGLSQEERNVLLDSATLLFLEHNICFRETDPLIVHSYLVFPELINLKKPSLEEEQPTEDGAAYTVSGAVENVYASLVVLLGYTPMFTRTNQWRNEARYEVGDGLICGFRQDGERDGELELVLYFGKNVGSPARTLFRGLFESFLARRNLSVFRYEPVICGKCRQPLDRAVVRDRLRGGKDFAYCPECSEKLALPKAHEPIQLRQEEQRKVDEQQWFADRRSRFEQAVFQLASYAETQKLARPECFISYAWGDKDQERWVERNLASDLQKAGVDVLLDRWENARVGASVMRFVERIHQCDKVIVVGTPAYGKKYANKEPEKGFVVAAEGDLIAPRMLSTEAKKESVLPLLLAGDIEESLPPWLHGRVHADFRNERDYFTTAFDLFLNLYGISHGNSAVADLRESLREREMR